MKKTIRKILLVLFAVFIFLLFLLPSLLFSGTSVDQNSKESQLYDLYCFPEITFPFLAVFADARNMAIGTTGMMFGDEAFVAYYNPGAMALVGNHFNSSFAMSEDLPNSMMDEMWYLNFFINYDLDRGSSERELGRLGLGVQTVYNYGYSIGYYCILGPSGREHANYLSYAYLTVLLKATLEPISS